MTCKGGFQARAFPWLLYLAYLALALVRIGAGCRWGSFALAGQGIFAVADLLVAGLLWVGPGSLVPPGKKGSAVSPRTWFLLVGMAALLLFMTGILLIRKGILYPGGGSCREVYPAAAVLPLFIALALFFLGRYACRAGLRLNSLFPELLAGGTGRETIMLAAVSAAVIASRLGYPPGEPLLLLAAGAGVLQLSLELAREWFQKLVQPLPAERVLAAIGRRLGREKPGMIPGRVEAFPGDGFLQIKVHILSDPGDEGKGSREEELETCLKGSLEELDRPGIRLVPEKKVGEGEPSIYRLFYS